VGERDAERKGSTRSRLVGGCIIVEVAVGPRRGDPSEVGDESQTRRRLGGRRRVGGEREASVQMAEGTRAFARGWERRQRAGHRRTATIPAQRVKCRRFAPGLADRDPGWVGSADGLRSAREAFGQPETKRAAERRGVRRRRLRRRRQQDHRSQPLGHAYQRTAQRLGGPERRALVHTPTRDRSAQ